MSVNKYKPHVLLIPEDDANRQLANGFLRMGNRAGQKRAELRPQARDDFLTKAAAVVVELEGVAPRTAHHHQFDLEGFGATVELRNLHPHLASLHWPAQVNELETYGTLAWA